jgi:hypothetical protein
MAVCVSFATAPSTSAQTPSSPPRPDPATPTSEQAATPPQADTRAELLRKEREAKEAAVKPYVRNGFESAMHYIEEDAIFLLTREGLYPKLGSLTTGSGFAAGLGYRNSRVFNRHGIFDVYAAGTLKKYWALEASATFPKLADDHLFLQAYGGRREYPQEDFFGLGPDARREDQVAFDLTTNRFGGRAGVKPVSKVMFGGGAELLQQSVGRGRDERVPSIEERFDDQAAPGLARQPDFLRTSAFVDIDYRKPLYARNGGWYRAEYSHIDDRDYDTYTFNRLDVDLRQYVGFFAERRVLSGRVFMSTSDAENGQQVPFYLMPYLGGNDTLRGFREYRFRGPNLLLMQAEYRFEIWSGLDMAFFYDTGKVALRRSELDLKDLEKDYGVGFRFNTDSGVVMRVDAAFGSRDGRHLYITFGGVF